MMELEVPQSGCGCIEQNVYVLKPLQPRRADVYRELSEHVIGRLIKPSDRFLHKSNPAQECTHGGGCFNIGMELYIRQGVENGIRVRMPSNTTTSEFVENQ